MKKHLIAVAVASAIAAPAMAQTVELYGRAHVLVDRWSAKGATDPTQSMDGRTRVVDNGSRIGFRVNEDLGGGLRAFALLEGGINIDNPNEWTLTGGPGQSGGANTGTGGFGTREAHVGIGNRNAEVRLGRQNVYWANGPVEDVAANHITFGGVGTFTSMSSGYVGAPAARQENTIMIVGNAGLVGPFAGSNIWYSTPNSAERAGTSASGTTNPTSAEAKAQAQGATIRYVSGPWAAQYDYGVQKNTLNTPGVGLDRNNTGNKFGVAYTMGTTKISGHWFKMEREFTLQATNEAALGISAGGGSQQGYGVSVTHGFGPMAAYVQYAQLGDFKHVTGGKQDNTSTTSTAVGLRYNLSKRTHVYTSFNLVQNEANAFVNMSPGGYSSTQRIGNGADQKSTTVGLFHAF